MAKISTFIDDFSGLTLDRTKWTGRSDVIIYNGRARMPSTLSYSWIDSIASFDISNSSIHAQLTPAPTGNGGHELYFGVEAGDSRNIVTIFIAGGDLQMYIKQANVASTTTLTYDALQHAWVRLREASGTMYWDTSPDGITWTARRTVVHSLETTTMIVSMSAGYWGSESPLYSYVDNVNVEVATETPPPATDWEIIANDYEKTYIYKVYTAAGIYIGVWNDVTDDPQFSQRLNTPGTTMTVRLARSANTTKEVRGNLLTEASEAITAEDGTRLSVSYEANNTVGEDSDVELNYKVDVYVVYGDWGNLTTEAGEFLTTEAGENLLVGSGAPMGVRIFSGFIMDYDAEYGDDSGVTVTLASHGYELSNTLIRSGSTTTVSYSTTEIGAIVKSILDTNPGTMTYSAASIDSTATSVTEKYQMNTKLEGIESAFSQTPDGWYWYGNVADNYIYLKQKSSTATHTFIKGKHIKKLNLRRSIENLKNLVYFVGGEVTPGEPSTTLYKTYEDATSQAAWRVGLERITDRRYTLAASAANRSNKVMARYENPIYTSTMTISSAKYDIELIKLGDTAAFANFGNYIDGVILQVVALSYTPTAVTLDLGDLQDRQIDSVADVEQGLQNEQYETLPTTPN